MRIAVDLDGTLAETQRTVLKELRKQEEVSDRLEDLESYYFEKADFSLETFHETARKIWENKDMPLTQEDIPEHLNQIQERHTVEIVTARGDIPQKDLKNWLRNKGIKFDSFQVDKKKTHLDYDFLVDDSPKYLGGEMKILLYHRPYNRNAETGSKDKRVKDFSQVRKHVEDIAGK